MPSRGVRTPDHVVDLRSDTVTRPTAGMRAAMAAAEVGDDVYGEDPTVRALEDEVAGLFGAGAALFVPSGTMGNQIGLRLLVPPAGELICDADAHVVTYEHGATAAHGGIQSRTVTGPRGLLDPSAVAAAIRPPGFHAVATCAVAFEQTHNRGGGAVHPLPVLRRLREVTQAAGVSVHCDGARVWNALVAAATSGTDLGPLVDTMSVCLSKGLGAPVGSVLVMPADRETDARELRARLGGGMRQAGILAAAGLYALAHHRERLADDHARAHRLAVRLADAAPGCVDVEACETNLVPVDVPDALQFAELARAAGVAVSAMGPRRARLVTHLDVDDDDVSYAADVLAALVAGRPG